MLDGKTRRRRRPGVRRGAPDRDDARGHPRVRRPDHRRRRRLTRRHRSRGRRERRPARRGDHAREEPGRRRRDRHRLPARARARRRRHLRDGRRQPDGPGRPRGDRRPGRARRGRLREGEPALHGARLGADPAQPLPRQRRALAADEDRVRLLARRRLAVRLHGGRQEHARAARPRPDLPALRLPERHARPPERDQRARAGRAVAAGLRRRREVGNPAQPRRSRRSPGC